MSETFPFAFGQVYIIIIQQRILCRSELLNLVPVINKLRNIIFRTRIICENVLEFYLVNEHKIYNPSYEGGLIVRFDQIVYYAKRSQGRYLKRFLKKIMFNEMIGLQFESFHVFFEIIDRKIQQLFTAGITNYFFEQATADQNLERYKKVDVDEPQVLTMNHFEAVFAIWLIALSFAIIILMFEWIIRFKDFLVFKYVWISFCTQNEVQEEVRRLFVVSQEEEEDVLGPYDIEEEELESEEISDSE